MILRCTEKLLKEAGLRKSALIDVNSDSGGIDGWYGNLLRVGSQKCLLFTNVETLMIYGRRSAAGTSCAWHACQQLRGNLREES